VILDLMDFGLKSKDFESELMDKRGKLESEENQMLPPWLSEQSVAKRDKVILLG
ncbi:hypothetical protein A2U01_0035603, partial [Trifolium medium]|nr:hypothetical protein [Trifolium medium]